MINIIIRLLNEGFFVQLELNIEDNWFWTCTFFTCTKIIVLCADKFLLFSLMNSPSIMCTLFNRTRVDQNSYPLCNFALLFQFSKVVHSFFIWLFVHCFYILNFDVFKETNYHALLGWERSWNGVRTSHFLLHRLPILLQVIISWPCDLILLGICLLEWLHW